MNNATSEKEAVLNVFAGLIRPLMRVAFEYGISASEASSAVRRTYIQALEARLAEQNRPTTDARLAIVSGLARSDVTALRDAARVGAPHSLRGKVTLDHIANLLTVWHTDTNFSGAYGLALELDLVSVPGSPRRTFGELIKVACPGVDQEALLDELLAAGSIEIIDSTTVRCLSRAHVQKDADVRRIERMGHFLSVIAGNFVHNLLRASSDPVYFERAVTSDDPLSETGRNRFMAVASERAQELLVELDTFLARLGGTDVVQTGAFGKRYGLGIYFFEDQFDETRGVSNERRQTPSPLEEIDVLAGLSGQQN